MSIASWPNKEQPREKLISHGAETLSDTELLAIFIRCGTKGKTAIDLARLLLQRFGSIRNLLDADLTQICQSPGLGRTKYTELKAAVELTRRYLHEKIHHTNIISNAKAAYLFLTAKLRDRKQEIFACLFLDNQNRLLHYEELFFGTINSANVYPREIIKMALQHNASGLIFAHNHTSGASTPSPHDKILTQKLRKILEPLSIRVLDHIIIGSNSYTSLAKTGLL
jgi:DNA repair protein RadC